VDRPTLLGFTKHTEMLISPKAVGKLYQRAEMLSRLPLGVQKWIVGRVSREQQHIGFVVEPYSYFLAYEVTDPDAARAQLPPHYELVPTAIFEGTEPKLTAIIAAFNVHTSVFWGSRVEFYLIAENQRTGLLSWVICDYESNTISYDPGRGFSAASTSHSVVTTTHAGDLIVDVRGDGSGQHLASTASLEGALMRPLDQRLWLEGNLSVDYGGRLLDPDSVPFGLVFDPGEVERALEIPLPSVRVERNTFVDGLCATEPFEVCTFPYAQHYQTSSFPTENPITDGAALEQAATSLSTPPA
jgi:hypothetical protein